MLSPAELRKLLRKEFNRAGKVKVEGNRMEYRFASNDSIVKQIITKAKAEAAEKAKAEKQEEEKPGPEKVEEPQTNQEGN